MAFHSQNEHIAKNERIVYSEYILKPAIAKLLFCYCLLYNIDKYHRRARSRCLSLAAVRKAPKYGA